VEVVVTGTLIDDDGEAVGARDNGEEAVTPDDKLGVPKRPPGPHDFGIAWLDTAHLLVQSERFRRTWVLDNVEDANLNNVLDYTFRQGSIRSKQSYRERKRLTIVLLANITQVIIFNLAFCYSVPLS